MKRCRGLIYIWILLPFLTDVVDSRTTLKDKARDALKNCRLTLGRSCPDPLFVKFHLYTRRNQAQSQLVQVTGKRDNLAKTFFNPSNPNKVIIHGFTPRSYKSALVSVKDAYLSREDANVWMVEWSRLAAGGACVMFSLRNTDHVARCVAQLVAAIDRHAPDPAIHVVADRAGVRVAHILAHTVTPLRLTRITGLNPEGGTVPTGNDDFRLSPNDAEFVDTIHTSPFLPKTDIFGQIDFYVNPNKFHQPGCDKLETGRFVCDQRRAIEYFAESITSQVGFLAWECSSYTNYALGTCNPTSSSQTLSMGDSCPSEGTGFFITYTGEDSPYALGHWDEKLYQEKGPKMRTDKISLYSTTIKRKMEILDEKTPELMKEFGIYDNLKEKLDDRTKDLKTTAINIGLKGAKALAAQIMKKNKLPIMNENQSQAVNDMVQADK